MALRFGMSHSPCYSQLRIIRDTLLLQSQKFIAKDLKDLCASETRNLGKRETQVKFKDYVCGRCRTSMPIFSDFPSVPCDSQKCLINNPI